MKSGIVVASSPEGTAATPGTTWVAIQSSTTAGVGMPPSSSPGEGAAETPKEMRVVRIPSYCDPPQVGPSQGGSGDSERGQAGAKTSLDLDASSPLTP